MTRMFMVVAMVAMVLAVALPAFGQVEGADCSGEFNVGTGGTATSSAPGGDIAIGDIVIGGDANIDIRANGGTAISDTSGGDFNRINQDCDTINEGDTLNQGDTFNDNDTQEFDQEAESGSVDTPTNIISEGDNSAQCAPVLQSPNTGNPMSTEGVLGSAEDTELGGSEIGVTPELPIECQQSIASG